MSEEDKRVSKTLIDLWTSFAKTGFDVQQLQKSADFSWIYYLLRFSEPSSDVVPDWPTVSKEQNQYLNIKLEPEVVIDQMPFHNRLEFWNPVVFPARAREELWCQYVFYHECNIENFHFKEEILDEYELSTFLLYNNQ